jgi:negative regulator of flagellin synthesis FlgM
MYVYGSSYVHGPQPLGAPHRPAQTPSAGAGNFATTDSVSFSRQADLIGRVREMPEIRADRVADLKRQIASGNYDTDQKLDAALDRMLDEIGAW